MSFWVAGAAVVGTIGGAVISSNGAKKAGNAAAAGSQAGIDELGRQYNQTRTDNSVGTAIGNQALLALGRGMGYAPPNKPLTFQDWSAQNPTQAVAPPAPKKKHGGLLGHLKHALNPLSAFESAGVIGGKGGAADPNAYAQQGYQNYLQTFDYTPQTGAPGAGGANAPDYSEYYKSPDYTFRRDEGTRGIERTAAARGGAASGNALKALDEFNQSLAAGGYNDYFSHNLALAGIGTGATNSTTQAGTYTAANTANLLGQQGDARASGIADRSNAIGSGLSDLAGIGGYYFGNRKPNALRNSSSGNYGYGVPSYGRYA